MSTPFLNIHWALDKINMTGSTLQLYNGITLITTFFLCRVVWGNYQTYYVITDLLSAIHHQRAKDLSTKTIITGVDVEGTNDALLPVWLAYTYLVLNTVLSWLNLYWFWLMVKAVRKRFAPKEVDRRPLKEESGKIE